ncbi:MAG TPA: M1 family aminopeptidase [Steroidobacteraceae bacterium]|jgi:aminopeptidase N|nr:M1 family aminopeptidase [Steroidobacteraceae bacterium]
MKPALKSAALSVALICSCVAGAGTASSDPGKMQWAPSRTYHVENYKLTLHFSQARGEVFGDELVTIRPFAAGFDRFCINSAELTIDSVTMAGTAGMAAALAHTTDDHCLWIGLKRTYGPSDSLNIRIVYHGHPRIGLFFVNPGRNDRDAPREIYTQGEPEFNHYWFPCWDYPNDMSRSETITTVPEGQVVVSNGKLVSVKRAAGRVTYDWVESVPHSSYLLSLAIGPWKKTSDSYEGKPVDYYVPRGVNDAEVKRLFHLTPDMIGFFSRATGVEYPFEKYAQVTVRDFIFGGQENVSATTLTDAALHDAQAEIDDPTTTLVAHELGQHWFGDYAQGRDWANIWLNEGFATYMTALYTQYHVSNDAYRYEIYNDQNTALGVDALRGHRPLVAHEYVDPLDMLEEITHDKGAAVLDMMRYVLDGDAAMQSPASQNETLFQALHYYLTTHEARTADSTELLRSIWTSTGNELGWFFHEWVFEGGHPDYRVSATYDPRRKTEVVRVAQTQKVDANTPVFDMPIDLAFFGDGNQRLETRIRDDGATRVFDIPLPFVPAWVDFDPDDILYKSVVFDKTDGELIKEAQHDPHMMSRLWAAQRLGDRLKENQGCCVRALQRVLDHDSFYAVRIQAAISLGAGRSGQAKQALLNAMSQADSRVRAAAVSAMSNFLGDRALIDTLIRTLHEDPSYAVQAAAAEELGRSGDDAAFNAIRSESESKLQEIVAVGILDALAESGKPQAAGILLRYAQPGTPERVREHALSDLPKLKDELQRFDAPALAGTVGDALDDPYLPVHEVADHLVDVFKLAQFTAVIERDADQAVIVDDRNDARRILRDLRRP